MATRGVACGVDRLHGEWAAVIKKRRFALVTGSAGVDSSGTPVHALLSRLGGGLMRAIWALQHGFFVDQQDNMRYSESFHWSDGKMMVRGLYRENPLPEEEWLEGIDALVVDVFDVGTRVYTFLNHLILIMRHLSGRGIDIVVLDRPNPLGGRLEGNVCREDHFSIVGALPVPMRHGLTAGEYLGYALAFHGIDLNLEIVKVRGWRRRHGFSGIWTYPSPNMPGLRPAALYPGAVLLEGTNLSEGRGTTRPFEFFGSPGLDHTGLAAVLAGQRCWNADFVPLFFKPEFSKHGGRVCQGLLVHAHDPLACGSFALFYEIIRQVRHRFDPQFCWQSPPYEFEWNRLPIDMICGGDLIRSAIEADRPFPDIEKAILGEIDGFREKVSPFLLYP